MPQTQDESHRAGPIIWLNLVCLDAPLVALVWQDVFARARFGHVSPAARVALFATAWLIYLADRLGDSFSVPAGAPVSRRQQFARRHRAFFLIASAIAGALDASAVPRLDSGTLIAGALIGAVSAVYLAVNHFISRLWRVLPIKEIAIGFLFAAGVRASATGPGAARFGYVAAVFAVLCALNCISIAFWERDLDDAQGRGSIATAFPRLGRWPLFACIALSIICAALAVASPLRLPLLCLAVSSALLALLSADRFVLERDVRTALADVVLLTPLLALPFTV
ncbi:MAG: hypothetical protein ACJ8KU_06315 [Chthoniobacterales bacterium]